MKTQQVAISKFRIRAYRSCKSTTFHPSKSLTALIGPNGAGKTNILNAIQLLRHNRRRARVGEGLQLKCQIEADFTFRKQVVYFKSRIVVRANEKNVDEVIQSTEKWNFKNLGWSNQWVSTAEANLLSYDDAALNQPLLYRRTSLGVRFVSPDEYPLLRRQSSSKKFVALPKLAKDAFRAIQGFRSNIAYYSASQFTNPSLCPTSFEVDEDGDLVEAFRPRQEHTQFIASIYQLSRENRTAYDRYLSLVKKNGIGLIDDLKWKAVPFKSTAYEVQSGGKIINKKRQRTLIVPTIQIDRSQLSFNQLSEGTFRALALLFYVVTNESSLLLIEEPEVCVHHGLLKSLIEIMREFSKRKQIVISTHSDFIIDTLKPEQVFLVRNERINGTTVSAISKTMSNKEFGALKKYLEEAGTLGEYWKHSGF